MWAEHVRLALKRADAVCSSHRSNYKYIHNLDPSMPTEILAPRCQKLTRCDELCHLRCWMADHHPYKIVLAYPAGRPQSFLEALRVSSTNSGTCVKTQEVRIHNAKQVCSEGRTTITSGGDQARAQIRNTCIRWPSTPGQCNYVFYPVFINFLYGDVS